MSKQIKYKENMPLDQFELFFDQHIETIKKYNEIINRADDIISFLNPKNK